MAPTRPLIVSAFRRNCHPPRLFSMIRWNRHCSCRKIDCRRYSSLAAPPFRSCRSLWTMTPMAPGILAWQATEPFLAWSSCCPSDHDTGAIRLILPSLSSAPHALPDARPHRHASFSASVRSNRGGTARCYHHTSVNFGFHRGLREPASSNTLAGCRSRAHWVDRIFSPAPRSRPAACFSPALPI